MSRTHAQDAADRDRARASLEVPERSLDLVRMLARLGNDELDAEQWAQAIAEPIVTAELMRLAYGFATIDDTDPSGQLRNRVDELGGRS